MGTRAYTVSPFWRGVLPGARLGAIVLLAGLAALIAATGGYASSALWLACAALVVGLAVSGPLSPEFPGASRWAFVVVVAAATLFVDGPAADPAAGRGATMPRALVGAVPGGPVGGG